MIRTGVLLAALLLIVNVGLALNKPKSNSLYYGLGVGSSIGKDNEGMGFVYTTGLLMPMKNDRFRLNPSLSLGSYSSKTIVDARDQQFRNVSAGMGVWVDLVQETSFSLMVGGGTLLCHSKGLLGNAVDENGMLTESPAYFSNYYWGGMFGIGFRFSYPDRRVNFELRPLSIHFGGTGFMEVSAALGVDIRL